MYKDYECTNGWSNYGDVTIEEGAIFVKKNDYKTFSDYDLVAVEYDYDKEEFQLHECNIDINDSWIDKKAVINCCDTKENDNIDMVLSVYYYYGSYHIGGSFDTYETTKELYKALKEMEVIK
jgi:hypothetical protein